MTTRTKSLEAYKKAIKAKYEIEKHGKYSSFLSNPSRAKLRQLCEERLKETREKEDRLSFNLVFGFEYEAGNRNRLKSLTDKFRPIETFFKGETDLADTETINIAALLVDYKPRPFRVFVEKSKNITALQQDVTIPTKEEETPIVNDKTPQPKNKWKKKVGIGILAVTGLFSAGYTAKDLVANDKECIQWQIDHYEYVDCNNTTPNHFLEIPIEPVDEKKIDLKKIDVSEKTTFFINDKPVIWYCKVNGEPEFFNTHGFHPITGKPLKPITNYMIDKWVKKKD